LHFNHGQEQQTQARADSSIRGLWRLGILRGGVLLWVRGVSCSRLSPSVVRWLGRLSGDCRGGLTYIRAVERSGLEGSDESKYSSDEEDSPEEDDEGDDDDDGGDGSRGGNGGSRGGDDGSSRGSGGGGSSKGSNKDSG
jgi:uncharacterized membrane protein YgcG